MGESPPLGDIDEIYAAHFQGLTVELYAYTGDLGLAQELVQEAFCRAIPRWSKLSTYDNPVTWLRRVAFNLAVSRWRQARVATSFLRRHREVVVPEPSPDRVALVAALKRLPANHRRVVVLHHLGDVPIAEIADAEGVPEGTVRVWLDRGRAALAVHLAGAGKDHSHG
jgi:RNA polymerase sigma-70 factor (ECF subfamily)